MADPQKEAMAGSLILFLGLISFGGVRGDANNMKCQSTKLVVYKVTFATFWDQDKFPKQYPEWRPPAQWSKLIGKTNITFLFDLICPAGKWVGYSEFHPLPNKKSLLFG